LVAVTRIERVTRGL